MRVNTYIVRINWFATFVAYNVQYPTLFIRGASSSDKVSGGSSDLVVL